MGRKKKIEKLAVDESLVSTMAKDVIESYVFSTVRRQERPSIYAERLILQLVNLAQCQTSGLDFKAGSGITQVAIGKLGNMEVEIDISSLFPGENPSLNYAYAKAAVKDLALRYYEYETYKTGKDGEILRDKDGREIKQYEIHHILNDADVNVKPGKIVVNVNKTTWQKILDFSKGFRIYDYNVAARLSGPYSLILFKLVSHQKTPITYTVEELRSILGVRDKYVSSTSNMLKNTVEAAKRELDESAPWTFEYATVVSRDPEKKGRRGRGEITGVTIYPRHQIKYETTTSSLGRSQSPHVVLGNEIYGRLENGLGFSSKEIENNLNLFEAVKRYSDLEKLLIEITPDALRAQTPQAYTIGALKRHLSSVGVVIRKDGSIVKRNSPADATEQSRQAARDAYPMEKVREIRSGGADRRAEGSDEKGLDNVLGGLFAGMEDHDA